MRGGGQEPPRALCLTAEDRRVIVGRLARAVLSFQDSFLSREQSPAGLLCQVWLPEVVHPDNEVVLKTKGMPFCVAGMGDLLALFRCISCRFAFGTNVARPTTLGAPGRVYTSSEPEMCCNVQQYGKQQYLRKAEAQQCQVQSTLLLPLFISRTRSVCVGVLEVVQTSQDMAFADVAELLAVALERCDLYTCGLEAIKRRAPSANTIATVLLPPVVGVLEAAASPQELTSEDGEDARGGQQGGGQQGGGDAPMAEAGDTKSSHGGRATSEDFSGDEEDEEEEDDEEEEEDDSGGGRRRHNATRGGGVHAKSRRKGMGNPGKPGVRLTLADLQSQFGVGLKEAAQRLGICPTTLKRACRRHGIQRWPRRQLQKVNRALDELEARQMMQPQQHLLAPPAAAPPAPYAPADGVHHAGADNRWTTLAQFIPSYHSNSGMLQGFEESQFRGGLTPYTITVQQTDATAVQQAAAQQQLHLLQQQQHAQQQLMQQAPLLGGRPSASGLSLPDGALAMGSGGALQMGSGGVPAMSTVSGVSTLGQPPPQASGALSLQQQQQQQQQQAAGGAEVKRETSGGSSGRAAEFGRGGGTQYTSPFGAGRPMGAAGMSGMPVVQLPAGHDMQGAGPRLSSLSVPSLHVDVMGGGGGLGPSPLADDDQVGFLDSSVLELLLTEEQRRGTANGNGGAAGDMAGGLSMSLPGLSTGASGLSFMM